MQEQNESLVENLKIDLTQDYKAKADDLESTVSDDERKAWYSHPLTRSLQLRLKGDFADIMSLWVEGAYTDEEDIAMYAMKASKAMTQAQALHDIILLLENIRDNQHG